AIRSPIARASSATAPLRCTRDRCASEPGAAHAALRSSRLHQALAARPSRGRSLETGVRTCNSRMADGPAHRFKDKCGPTTVALTVKCLCLYHPDDRAELRGAQERNLLRLAAACRAQQRELLLEIAAGGLGELEESTTARVLSRLYELGIRPDWWGLEPQPGASAWERCAAVIAANDEYCRG